MWNKYFQRIPLQVAPASQGVFEVSTVPRTGRPGWVVCFSNSVQEIGEYVRFTISKSPVLLQKT